MYSLGFLGAGKMGAALIDGLRERKEDVACLFFDASPERRKEVEDLCGFPSESGIDAVMAKSDAAVIAVKPQVYLSIAEEIGAAYRRGMIIISIMAGVKIETIAKHLPDDAKIIRLMPNMAMTVGAGVLLMTCNDKVSAAEKERIKGLFADMALVKEIPEKLMDAGTAISGSGPAFFYMMIEGMTLGGIEAGFGKDEAEELSVQTMKGAAALLEQTDKGPAKLREEMMSAGGTTVAGVSVLEKSGFRGDVGEAVCAARLRSKELSEGS